ncbi:hypothetical protein B5C34_01970 [Pacificimonas flava]|uniref:Peptidase C14 caspase domain-containing protein n=2 Tax=Pacificimonas TaxID=1960290 RepID=A0A219B1Y3_9SPHN|nr:MULTISPECIES: caspase family protein [Pacificimonas]MBZ6378015.1 caspase family protein [Pacificimonas aurantium]OWV32340.1 hypothetical protein B5C34_01970 [Pacificimonas flava]
MTRIRFPLASIAAALVAFLAIAGSPVRAADRALIVAAGSFSHPALKPYELIGADADVALMRSAWTRMTADRPADARAATPELVILSGADAATARVNRAFAELVGQAERGDRILLYLSAHGARIPDNGRLDEADGLDEVLLLADAAPWQPDARRLPGSLSDDEIGDVVDRLRSRGADVFLVIDSCASGGAVRSGAALQPRTLPPALLGLPQTVRRGARGLADPWVEADRRAGAGRLVTFAASPSDRPAFGGPSGGLFTRSLAAAIDGDPATFAMLARKQLAAARGTPASAGSTVLGGQIGAAFFFAGTVPGPLEFAARLDPARLSLSAHRAAQDRCPDGKAGPPAEIDLSAAPLALSHCDLVLLSVDDDELGRVDAWYVDSAGHQTLVSPIEGYPVGLGRPARLSFTFVDRDPETERPLPPGMDRLVLLRRPLGSDEPVSAQVLRFRVGDPP